MGIEDIIYDLIKTARDKKVSQKEQEKAAYEAVKRTLKALIRDWNNFRKVRPVHLYTEGKGIFNRYYNILGTLIEDTEEIIDGKISSALNDLRMQLYQGTEFLEVMGAGNRFIEEGDGIRATAENLLEQFL